MQAEFWHQCWDNNQIAFHEPEANPLLVKHFNQLNLSKSDRVFLPLCGKTTSIPWLRSQGFHVAGIELSEIAVQQLFSDLNIVPCISKEENVLRYQSEGIDIFVGDFFELTSEILGKVHGIYDRGSLVALPYQMRLRYAQHLKTITNNATQLLVCYEYDENEMQGPPFSIPLRELKGHYEDSYEFELLETKDAKFVEDGLNIVEKAWFIEPR